MAKNLNFQSPPSLAIANNATTPNPGVAGVGVWSTTLNRMVYWTGSEWSVDSSGGGSGGNTVIDGGTPYSIYGGTTPINGGTP